MDATPFNRLAIYSRAVGRSSALYTQIMANRASAGDGSTMPVFPDSLIYQPSWTVVLVVSAVAVYCVWYYLLVVNKPRLLGGGTALKEHVLNHCPILSQYYYPTFWAPNCHFTTIGRAKLQKCPGVTFER